MQTLVLSIANVPTSLQTAADRQPAAQTVGARARATVVKVPSWFTVSAALRVAQLKAVSHLLILDRGLLVGAIDARTLLSSPANDPLARWMTASTATVALEASTSEALRLMMRLDLDCLPVTSGPLLVGLVTREDLADEADRAA